MPRTTLLVALSACFVAAACGGPASVPTAATAAPAAPSPALSSSATGSSAAAPAAASSAGSFQGAALCTFLESELLALQKAGSTGGAISVLAIDYANWIAADDSRKLPDAAAMDTATKASCPAIRTAVLKTLGGDSFSVAF